VTFNSNNGQGEINMETSARMGESKEQMDEGQGLPRTEDGGLDVRLQLRRPEGGGTSAGGRSRRALPEG
jgi:hypothetical protein